MRVVSRRNGWTLDRKEMKVLALRTAMCIALSALVATIIIVANTAPAHACLFPGIPC